jgi:hypothetical protein
MGRPSDILPNVKIHIPSQFVLYSTFKEIISLVNEYPGQVYGRMNALGEVDTSQQKSIIKAVLTILFCIITFLTIMALFITFFPDQIRNLRLRLSACYRRRAMISIPQVKYSEQLLQS